MKNFKDLAKLVEGQPPKNLIVAVAEDIHVLEAVREAKKENIIDPILIGNRKQIENISEEIEFNLRDVVIIDEIEPDKACKRSVNMIRQGKADILMKGLVGTAPLLKAVLDQNNGLKKSDLLSHVSIFQTPYYHKLLGVSDVAMNIAPDLLEKVAIINNAVEVLISIGVDKPKVAMVCAVEIVNPAIPATLDAANLTMMNKRNQIKNCIIDGPLGFDNTISKEAADLKGIDSEVAGDADLLICHDINSGNILYKALSFLGGATVAAVIIGATVPIVLTSRADSEKNKLMSILLAAVL